MVVDAIREVYSLYPDYPGALEALNFATTLIDRPDEHDSLSLEINRRFEEMHSQFSSITTVGADTLSTMFFLALRIADFWKRRFLESAPLHPKAAVQRGHEIRWAMRGNATGLFREYERIWREAGPIWNVATMAWEEAKRVGNEDAMTRWAERRELLDPWIAETHASTFVEHERLRDVGITKLRSILVSLESRQDERRRLRVSVGEQNARDAIERHRLLAVLGQALIESGNVDEGLDTLVLATSTGWDPAAFEASAYAHLGIGDSTRALELFARVAIDPSTDQSKSDQIVELALNVVESDDWQQILVDAHAAMRSWLLQEGTNRTLPHLLRVTDEYNERVNLWEIVQGRPTLLVQWFWDCDDCVRDINTIASSLANIEQMGASVFALTSEETKVDMRRILDESGVEMRIFGDYEGDVKSATRAQGQPHYSVIDRLGRIRYSGLFPWKALRATLVLAREIEPTIASR